MKSMKIRLGFGSVLLVIMLGLTACEPPSSNGSSSAARTRLSISNSYGEFGEYVVHINAMPTTSLTTEVAQGYGVVRSENQGLINLVVLKKANTPGGNVPVTAVVDLSAANLTGQLKSVELREIDDGTSIYYIGQISVDDRETINFDFDIRPEAGRRVLLVRFTHQFYTD